MRERSRGSRRRAVAGALIALGLSLVLSGCTGEAGSDDARKAPASSTSPAHGEDDHVHGAETTAPATLQDPVATATRFLRNWSRPALPYREWWADLEPLFNAQGQQAYAGTDPAQVPLLRITGELEVEPSTVATSTTVWAPTNKGRFGVQLSRPSDHAAWLVSRVYFPDEDSVAGPDETGSRP